MRRKRLNQWIIEHDEFSRLKHGHFRRAAEAVAAAFTSLPEVLAISSFGSVALSFRTRITTDGPDDRIQPQVWVPFAR